MLHRLGGSFCFVVETPVLTMAGLVASETVEVGNTVIATDPETGETAEKEVVVTYVRQTNEPICVWADGEELVTAPTHPF